MINYKKRPILFLPPNVTCVTVHALQVRALLFLRESKRLPNKAFSPWKSRVKNFVVLVQTASECC